MAGKRSFLTYLNGLGMIAFGLVGLAYIFNIFRTSPENSSLSTIIIVSAATLYVFVRGITLLKK